MRLWWLSAPLGMVGVVAFASLVIAFDPSCWLSQRDRLETQVARMGSDQQAKHSGLIAEGRQQAQEILTRGRTLDANVRKETHEAVHKVQESDTRYQQNKESISQQWASVDVRNPAAVRAVQKEAERFYSRSTSEALGKVASAPKVDAAHAADTAFQKYVNGKEAAFQVRRQLAGVSDDQRAIAVNSAVDTALRDMQLRPEWAARLKHNDAYADAVSAAGLMAVVGKQGYIPENLEPAAAAARTPFDSARKVTVVVAAKALDASMTLSQIGGQWGGDSSVVDARGKMGAQTRQALTASGAHALNNYDQVTQAQRIMRGVSKIEVPSPHTADVGKTVGAVTKSLQGATKELERLVRGTPFVPPQ
jgi:hypothetical protein